MIGGLKIRNIEHEKNSGELNKVLRPVIPYGCHTFWQSTSWIRA